MADVNSTTTQNQTQQQSQTAPQNQPTQASGTQQQPQTDKHEENNSGGEVTVESLMAQLAQEKAANAKLKSDNDKLCTSEGNLRNTDCSGKILIQSVRTLLRSADHRHR